MKTLTALYAVLLTLAASPALAGPQYNHDRAELEAIMEDLKAWLPGSWDSFPQVYYERTVTMPEEGEHDHWHRTFALIDAPQVGDVVFYGQINVNGRDGPILGRSQVLYKATIDEERGVVNINGQSPADPEKFENLHDRPELWGDVQMRDEAAIRCDFIWRRDAGNIFGVLDGKTEERRKYGPGTCTYFSENAQAEFKADAEWVLGPELLWLYDANWMEDQLFVGREDLTHTKLFRTRPYSCKVKDANGTQTVDAYDRGFSGNVAGKDGQDLEMLLLRADYPAADGSGLDDRLRLMITDPATEATLAMSDSDPLSNRIEASASGVNVACKRQSEFSSMPPVE